MACGVGDIHQIAVEAEDLLPIIIFGANYDGPVWCA
jgi:hypothetical protein